ncbi:gem-associated protein 5 [Periplaneta americana]|uniref:gem-associated protein 5 n=1 Tax=Periplaneta americana TaxID=6978 RepID=UPI0037E8A1D5
MNDEILPPSPNWYLSNVLACAADGTIAYGSRNNIVIARSVVGSTSHTPNISIISSAHKERITVVSFSTVGDDTNTYWNCLASAGDDSVVKVWNLDSLAPLLAHNSHAEGMKVLSMDWSKSDPNLIVSADESGSIVCWNVFSNTTQKLNFGKLVPTSLACCPHRRDLVAIGTRSGLVCTISLKGNGKMLHRLRGHDSEVVSLAWCPVSYNIFHQKQPQGDMLLATGAKEKTIYIWRAGGDGRYETMLNLPVAPMLQETGGGQQHKSRLGNSVAGGGNWSCVSWPEPNTLLSSSLWGELLSFNLQQYAVGKSNKQSATKLWHLVHACHARGLFSIACVPVTGALPSVGQTLLKENGYEKENGDMKPATAVSGDDDVETLTQSQIVWTTAQDRQLVACHWKTGNLIANIPTLGGFVYCIAACPLDPNRIAFGVGDGMIRVWDLSNSTTLEITLLWQKIKGKVMALAWHPAKEGWLAYATSEGRVGLYDVSCGKAPVLFRPYHRRTVYTLCWGPSVYKPGAEERTGNYLYSCGDGEVVRYDPENPNDEPFKLKDILHIPDLNSKKDIQKTDIAWKPDNSMLAIGNEDGTVHIVTAPHLTLVHTLFAHKKLIQCVAWHPESTATDTSYSPYQHWLAVASNETHIKVFDLSQLIKGDTDAEANHVSPTQSCITLSGHLNRVVSMCWSPHIGGQLVSVSYDNTAQVWNVPAQQAVANFCSHCCYVLCCVWSPLDPDLVITGSSDFTLRVWRVSNQTQTLPPERKKQKKLEAKKMKFATATEADSDVNLQPKTEVDEKVKTTVKSMEETDTVTEFARSEKEACESSSVHTSKKKKTPITKSFFPVSSIQKNLKNVQHFTNCCHLLASLNTNVPVVDGVCTETSELPPYLGFFGDRNAMQKLLDMEVEQHNNNGQFELAQNLELWRGNITEMLREAARRKQLSDWLVSLAPMGSQRLWMEMCRAYSEQLVVCGEYQKAASYLLICHKINEAIEVLTSHQLFREALAIARCRLGPDDPTCKKIICDWGRHVASQGNYELAVMCLISVGEFIEAAMLIRKRNDESSLKLAAKIAEKAGAQDLASMLASQSMKQSLLAGKLEVASEVAAEYSHLKHLGLLFTAHKTLAELSVLSERSLYQKWLHECKDLPSEHTPLLELIKTSCQASISEEETREIYMMLLKEFGENENPDTKEKLWLAVSVEIALACMSDGAEKLRHLVAALSACYQYRQLYPSTENLLLQLCMWISPKGPFAERSLFCTDGAGDLQDVTTSLQAYLCAGVVDWAAEVLQASTSDIKNEDEENAETVRPDCEYCIKKNLGLLAFLKVCKNSVIKRESLEYFQDCVKIKKWENEIAKVFAKSRVPVNGTSAAEGDINGCVDSDNLLVKLEQLKQRKQAFETNSVSTPNPFVVYCKIKNLLHHFRNVDPENTGDLCEQFESLWMNVSSRA